MVNSNIRQAKANFVLKNLNDNAKDSSKFWRQIKEIYPGSKQKSTQAKIRLIGNNSSFPIPDSDTADYINKFFINVGNPPNADCNPLANCNTRDLGQPRPVNQYNQDNSTLEQPNLNLTESVVLDAVKQIEVHKSSGLPHFNNQILKSSLKVLIPQLTLFLTFQPDTAFFQHPGKRHSLFPYLRQEIYHQYLITDPSPFYHNLGKFWKNWYIIG